MFYNGEADYPAEKTLCLSDAFGSAGRDKKSLLELGVKVYNINKMSEAPVVRQCEPLAGYARLTQYAQEAKRAGRDDWLDFAVQRCIGEGVIADYLKKNSYEVRNMLIAEYDYDTDIKVKQQEAFEDGISQGATRQKEEDDKLLQTTVAKITAQKDAEVARQAAEIQRLLAENAQLRAQR